MFAKSFCLLEEILGAIREIESCQPIKRPQLLPENEIAKKIGLEIYIIRFSSFSLLLEAHSRVRAPGSLPRKQIGA